MYDLLSLMDQHDRLDALADRLIALSRTPGVAGAQCHALIGEMGAILAAHLPAEADFFYDNNAAGSGHDNDNALAATVADFERDFLLIEDQWRQYQRHWTPARIETEHDAFRLQTSDLMTALKLRIARENTLLYPLALETGRISLRPGGASALEPRRATR